MKKLLTIALILLAMALAGGQDAHAAPPPEGWGQAAINLAEAYWGSPPPLCTSVQWEFDATLAADGRSGEATQPQGTPIDCVARIGPQVSARALCLVVIHESGHLRGFGHSADPHNIMFGTPYGDVGPWEPDVPACDTFAVSVTHRTHKPTILR